MTWPIKGYEVSGKSCRDCVYKEQVGHVQYYCSLYHLDLKPHIKLLERLSPNRLAIMDLEFRKKYWSLAQLTKHLPFCKNISQDGSADKQKQSATTI